MDPASDRPGAVAPPAAPLLSIRSLTVSFARDGRVGRAVNDVSFDLSADESVGMVGESGSGKSVLARAALRLLPEPPARVESGEALYRGRDLLRMGRSEIEAIRGRRIAMIFQEPMSALNPLHTAGHQVAETLETSPLSRGRRRDRAIELLGEVGIADAARRAGAYPHELSGGMRQRVMIACALAPQPEILVADEPTTALDVTVQARVLERIDRLRRERGLALLLITHSLGVAARRTGRLLVFYAGRVVERGPTSAVLASPLHPYTRALLDCLPALDRRSLPRPIPGTVPSIFDEIPGCRFAPRCARALDGCRAADPPEREILPGRFARCLRAGEA